MATFNPKTGEDSKPLCDNCSVFDTRMVGGEPVGGWPQEGRAWVPLWGAGVCESCGTSLAVRA